MKDIKQQIDSLLTNDITRKDFLALIGAGILSVIGVTSLLKNLGLQSSNKQTSVPNYGDSLYGGVKR